MGAAEWISLISVIVLWIGTLITVWVKIRIKLTELDMKINNNSVRLKEHITWGENQQQNNINKFDSITDEMKDNFKELSGKIDILIEKFSDFKIYYEKNFKR